MFGRRKKNRSDYDRDRQRPALRKSICTGEETAGFIDRESGRIHEVMLIRNAKDLADFMEMYGIEETPETVY